MMPSSESRSVVVTIRKSGSSTTNSTDKANEKATGANIKKKTVASEDTGVSTAAASLFVYFASSAAKSGVEMANFYFNYVLSTTDDYKRQRALTNCLTTINAGVSLINSISYGATIGSVAGPAGTVIGGVVGGVVGIGQTALGVSETLIQQSLSVAQGNAQLGYQRQRAGYSLTSGSIGENR